MAQPPIIKAMDDMLAKLKESTQAYREAEKEVAEYTAAIRALAQVCEDEVTKTTYLIALEEISGKPGFVEAVRSALKASSAALTAPQVKGNILLLKKMDLSAYSNPMASIHTTLRRMKEKGDVAESTNDKGEKVYRLIPKAPAPPASMRKRLGLDKE